MCAPEDDDVLSLYEQYIDNSDNWQEYSDYQCHDDDEMYYDADYSDHDDSGSGSSYDDYSDNA